MPRPELSLAFTAIISALTAACGPAVNAGPLDCPNPAPLYGEPDVRAPGYMVALRDSATAQSAVRHLAAKFHLTLDSNAVWTDSPAPGFHALLPREVVSALRCEDGVEFVEHDMVFSGSGRTR